MLKNNNLKKELTVAIENNNPSLVKELLEMGANKNNENITFLSQAAEKGYIEIYKLLVEYGEIDDCEDYLLAISNGHMEMAIYLIKFATQMNIDLKDVISVAINSNQIEIVKLCLNNFNEDLMNEKQWLSLACEKSNVEIMELLINNNNDLLYELNDLLDDALKQDNLKSIKYLIEKNVNIKNEKEKILAYSIDENNKEMIELLINHGANIKEVVEKCNIRNFNKINVETLQLLEKYGVNMNIQIKNKNEYYLQIFAMFKNIEVVKYLTKKNSVQDAKNLAMIAAVSNLDQEMISYLIQNGANIHYNNDQILLEAIKLNCPKLATSLMQAGCDYKKNEEDILFYLIKDGNVVMLEELINQGADIYDDDKNFLASATFNNKLKVTKLLIEKGVSLIDNTLAFDGALCSKNIQIVQYIVDQYQNKKELIDYIDNIILAKSKMSALDASSDLVPSDEMLKESKIYINYKVLSDALVENQLTDKKNKL